MKKNIVLIVAGVIVLLLAITGFVVYKAVFAPAPASQQTTDQIAPSTLPQADSSISVNLVKSASAANTVTIQIKGMAGKMTSVGYELAYQSQGIGKGVTSGSKPADVTGQDAFTRDIYLGTCSRNDCKPDLGVSVVTLNVVFTDTAGKQSQFSKDYTL